MAPAFQSARWLANSPGPHYCIRIYDIRSVPVPGASSGAETPAFSTSDDSPSGGYNRIKQKPSSVLARKSRLNGLFELDASRGYYIWYLSCFRARWKSTEALPATALLSTATASLYDCFCSDDNPLYVSLAFPSGQNGKKLFSFARSQLWICEKCESSGNLENEPRSVNIETPKPLT